MADIEGSEILLDYAQDKVVLIDEDQVLRYVNRAVEQTLGYDPEDLVGTNAFEYVHPDDRSTVRGKFEEVITGEEFTDATVEYRFRAKDGTWRWLESRFSNLTDEQLDGYVVSSRDVTDRVEAERERDESQSRLAEIANKTADALWMFSADWRKLLFMNPAYEDVYGADIEAVRDDPSQFLEYIHPDDVPVVRDAMKRLSKGESVDIEYRVNPDKQFGTYVWVQAEPIFQDGEVVRIVGFTRDISGRRRRERQLAVMDNLLRHNLRNDLNVILAAADVIENEPEADIGAQTAIIRRVGHELVESAEKQRDIIEVLTESGSPATVGLVRKVHSAVSTVSRQYPDTEIEVDLPPSLPARALEEIEVAITELVENALEHARTDPTVKITGRMDGDNVLLTIRDNAPAIPEEEYRVLTGDREMDALYHSSGLGLWLIYWVVDLSDGSITFADDESAGNAITVRLDRANTETVGDSGLTPTGESQSEP